MYEQTIPIHLPSTGLTTCRILSLAHGQVDSLSSTKYQLTSMTNKAYFLLPSFSSFSSISCQFSSFSSCSGYFFSLPSTKSSIEDCTVLTSFQLSCSILSSHILTLSFSLQDNLFEFFFFYLLMNRLIDEHGLSIPISLQPSQQQEYCIGICIEPESLLTCEFLLQHHHNPFPDSILHLSQGSFSTSFSTKNTVVSTWSMDMTYRIWNEIDEILLFQLQQENQIFEIKYSPSKLIFYLNHQELFSFINEHSHEGKWCDISIQQTTHDLHFHWNDQTDILFNQSLFSLSSSCSIQVGNNQSEWDILSLTIQSHEHTLYCLDCMYTVFYFSLFLDLSLILLFHHQLKLHSFLLLFIL